MNDMEFTTMQAAQLPQVAALERLCFPDPWSEASFASELENPLSLWLVALDGGTVVGYAGSQTVFDEADLLNVAVHPAYRRQGVGRALLLALEQTLSARGVHSLTLEVRSSNEPAIALYRGLGYAPVGLRRNYYLKPKEDARIMRKTIGETL